MRPLLFILVLLIGLSCSNAKNAATKSNQLNGTWVPLQQEIGGDPLSKSTFESERLIISDSNYTFSAESVDKGIVKYQQGKMDIYGKEGVNTGKHFAAIYKLDSGLLTVCYNLGGDSYPVAFETKSKPMLFMSVFKKEETK